MDGEMMGRKKEKKERTSREKKEKSDQKRNNIENKFVKECLTKKMRNFWMRRRPKDRMIISR